MAAVIVVTHDRELPEEMINLLAEAEINKHMISSARSNIYPIAVLSIDNVGKRTPVA